MPKKRRAAQPRKMNKRHVEEAIRAYAEDFPERSINCSTIAAYLEARDGASRRLISECLYELAERNLLQETSHGNYRFEDERNAITARIEMQRGGSGEITLENGAIVEIPLRAMRNALDGDLVEVAISPARRGKTIRGEVLRIVQRARETFVGTLQVARHEAFLVPDNRRMPYDIIIPIKALEGGKHGQKAEVRITEWPAGVSNPLGEVVEVLGEAGLHEVEMHAILSEFELPYRYPKEVQQAAQSLEEGITPQEIARRKDMRGIPTITIDPTTAKDFDDALSIRPLPNEEFEVGVHIADVTHYVKRGSIIEQEAQKRATSVYLVDRTVPMLPERLCNEICSLRPNEDKLAFSAIFRMDAHAKVLDTWFGRTVIHSSARLTYEQAQETIEGKSEWMAYEIRTLNDLAKQLRADRFAKGAIDFAAQEVRFELDEKGAPIGVIALESNESHHLIEEFMLLANRSVAYHIAQSKLGKEPRPSVYRVHDLPNPEKLAALFTILAQLGKPYKGSVAHVDGKTITNILHSVRNTPEQHMIDLLTVRAMAKAIYSTNNIGHFGLAFPFYTHFTSPIRRYPDMMVHRILASTLEGKESTPIEELDDQCKHSSDMEKRAAEAERASIRYKQVEYLQSRKGSPFEGIITGVADFGFFVELAESKCEGLVATRDLTDDYYLYNEEQFSLTGSRNGRTFRLGDPVIVEVLRTDLALRRIDFIIISHKGESIEMPLGGSPLRMPGQADKQRKKRKDRTAHRQNGKSPRAPRRRK